MKRILLVMISLFSLLRLSAQKEPPIKYFEGVIEYEIKNEPFMQGVSDNEIKERSGTTLRFYFKDGSYIREYLDGSGYTLRKLLYIKEANMIYDYYPFSMPDTVYYAEASEPIYESYMVTPGKNEKIMDCECNSYEISVKYVASFMPDTGSIVMTYFFCPSLPVNPEWQKNMYIWKDVIKIGKSIATKFVEYDPLFMKQTYTATKITWQPVSEEVFKLDPKLTRAKMPKL